MILVDSHCHIDQIKLDAFDSNIDNLIQQAKDMHVGYFLCVCIDMNNASAVLKIAETYPNVFASVGVHPNETESYDPALEELIKLASHERIVAIGETGLDYYRTAEGMDWQHERFRRHIHAGKTVKKPLIIHTRDAREDTITIMKEENASEPGGVLHCFTESWEMAKQALDLGFYISFSGIVTFNNAKELQEVAKKVPQDRILIETDAPYLAPVPYRGKQNVPAYVYHVAEKIAELRNEPLELVAEYTTNNFFNLFPATREK